MTDAGELPQLLPLHLAGNNGPVADEVTVRPTRVVGEIPPDLRGRFVRNGPNPQTGWSAHLFDGDGMVHGVSLSGGEAGWYWNRYVLTPLHASPGESRLSLAFDRDTGRLDYAVTTANTHVVDHAGRLLALEEGGFPYELTPDLDTVGCYRFGGALATPMTAHPKICPRTGELLFFGYQLRPPFLTYHRVSAVGELVASSPLTLPAAAMLHDFAVTETRVVFFDSPLIFDPSAIDETGSPWRWDHVHGARVGVMPRDGGDADIRWLPITTGHLSHAANAWDVPGDPGDGDGYETGDQVVVTGTRLAGPTALPVMHRWTIDLASGRVAESALDDAASEYPRIAEARTGLDQRFVYTTSFVMDAEPERSLVYKYDLSRGAARTVHRFPDGHTCGEPVFVPRFGARLGREDDGYLLTFAHDRSTGLSYLAILDAVDVAGPPLAEVHLPVRVPAGFHGTWLPA